MTESSIGGTHSRAKGLLSRVNLGQYIIYLAFAVTFVLFAVVLDDRGFLTSGNLMNILRQSAIVGVIAVGMTFVIADAEIDLSVGSVSGLVSVVTAMAISHWGILAGIVVGLMVGMLIGLINGSLVAFVKIPSFLVTLAMMGIAFGLAQWVTDSAPQPILKQGYNMAFGSGDIGPLPGLVIWFLIVAGCGAFVLKKTRFGRHVVSVGANPTASIYTGISVVRTKFLVMLISAVVAALGGMLYAGRLQSGRYQWGQGDEMNAIAAVILGGTALAGGRGSVLGTVFGALFMGLINNGLILAGLSSPQQQVVRGVIIILAVALGSKK